MNRIYLDHAATTYVKPAVLEAMLPYFTEKFGNPGGVHSYSREAKAALDEARAVSYTHLMRTYRSGWTGN